MCTAETPASRQIKPAVDDDFKNLTMIANNPELTCIAEPCTELTDSSDAFHDQPLRIIANDPSRTCRAESTLANGDGSAKPPLESTRYWPAYMLQDGSLERAGRVSGAALLRKE